MPKKFSPFFTFVRFYRDGERGNGRQLTLDEAKKEADPIWANLSVSERERFVEMAEKQSLEQSSRPPRPRRVVVDPPSFRVKMRGFVEKFLSQVKDVRTHFFYFLSFHRETFSRLPSEVSVVRFSMTRGAEHFLHFLLNPEISPGEYALHKEKMRVPITVVPIEGTRNSQQNLGEVLNAIRDFCGGIAFTISSETELAIKCFTELRAACPGSQDIVPLDGEELMQMLWERSRDGRYAKLLDVRSACASQAALDHLACAYHKSSNNTGVCSLWKSYRLAYGFSKILARPYDFKVAEGYHKPRENWTPVGTYFSGKGDYENWASMSTASACDSAQTQSSSSASGDAAASNWLGADEHAWGL